MDETKTLKLVCARVSESVFRALLRACHSERRTRSQLIRIILEDWAKTQTDLGDKENTDASLD